MNDLVRELLAYIKPAAPLYAFESKRPTITSADDVRDAFNAREEDQELPAEVCMYVCMYVCYVGIVCTTLTHIA